MAFHKPCSKDNNFRGFWWLSANCVCLHAGIFSFRERGDGRWRGKKIAFPECLPCPSHWTGSFTEWGLLDPSQQSCRLGSIIRILRAGSCCSKESPPAQDCGVQARSVGVQGTCSCPPVRQHDGWRAFCQDLVVGFCPSLVKGRVRRVVAMLWRLWLEGVVKLWRDTCVIKSLSYVQENHETHLFCEVSWDTAIKYSNLIFRHV